MSDEGKRQQDAASRARPNEPGATPGLASGDFRKVGSRGLDDPGNAYPHSMAWFKNRLYVGTTRSNLCMLKKSQIQSNLLTWPVECPDDFYDLDMRAQIWSYDPYNDTWEKVFISPMIKGEDGEFFPRDLGYRAMLVYQADGDTEPVLYVATYASARGPGAYILRSEDGKEFTPVSKAGLVGLPTTTIRLLVPFKGRLFTSPTGRAKGNPNTSFLPIIFENRCPAGGDWIPVNEPGFGDKTNMVVFELCAFGDYLYAGTGNSSGFQLWRTQAEGKPPYRWELVITRGGFRGSLNQGVASFAVFKDMLYLGTGIQNGGVDRINKIGPAAPEIIRLDSDGRWDLVVGTARRTPSGIKHPISGFTPGFNNPFNGYFWRMAVHDDWLYMGTFDWSLMMRFADRSLWPSWFRDIVNRMGVENIIKTQAGFDFYRSYDGENWLPVSTNGFDNPYNYGIRTLASTPEGLFVGTVNPFAPKVAKQRDGDWVYEENPNGGLEIWLGSKETGQGQ